MAADGVEQAEAPRIVQPGPARQLARGQGGKRVVLAAELTDQQREGGGGWLRVPGQRRPAGPQGGTSGGSPGSSASASRGRVEPGDLQDSGQAHGRAAGGGLGVAE